MTSWPTTFPLRGLVSKQSSDVFFVVSQQTVKQTVGLSFIWVPMTFTCSIVYMYFQLRGAIWNESYIWFLSPDPHFLTAGVFSFKRHDDVIKWKLFPRYWPFVWGIHLSPVNSPHKKGQWRGALMFSLICVWMNDWVNNREAGGLRRYPAHYDVIVICIITLHQSKNHIKLSRKKRQHKLIAGQWCDTVLNTKYGTFPLWPPQTHWTNNMWWCKGLII